MSRAAAGAWTAASEGINNVGGALLRIMQQEREAKEREQARLDQKEYQTGLLENARGQLEVARSGQEINAAGQGLFATRAPIKDRPGPGFGPPDGAPPKAAPAGLGDDDDGPPSAGRALLNVLKPRMQNLTQRTGYAYDAARDPNKARADAQRAHDALLAENELSARRQEGESAREHAIRLARIQGDYGIRAASIAAASRGGGGPSAADRRASRERAEAEAGFIATGLIKNNGNDVARALAIARAQPPDPMRDLIIEQLHSLGQQQGSRAFLGIGGGDDLVQQFMNRNRE